MERGILFLILYIAKSLDILSTAPLLKCKISFQAKLKHKTNHVIVSTLQTRETTTT